VLARASSSASFRAIVDDDAQRVLAAKQAQGLLSCLRAFRARDLTCCRGE
jgi:hypothetical protein